MVDVEFFACSIFYNGWKILKREYFEVPRGSISALHVLYGSQWIFMSKYSFKKEKVLAKSRLMLSVLFAHTSY